jgi:hypothetical protein
LARFAIAATATGDVKGHRYQVALFYKFNITPRFYHYARYFVAKHYARRGGCTPAHHVLVAAANVGRYNFQDNAVVTFPVAQGQFRVLNFAHFNLPGF